jgi:hypothetical protein
MSPEIRLIRVMPGDRQEEARSWVLAVKGNDFCGRTTEVDRSLYGRGLAWYRPLRTPDDGERIARGVPEDQASLSATGLVERGRHRRIRRKIPTSGSRSDLRTNSAGQTLSASEPSKSSPTGTVS